MIFQRQTTIFYVCLSIALSSILAGCATGLQAHHNHAANIGPFKHFNGRLLVLQPHKRWQVQIQWQGDTKKGKVRLTHPATGRIVYLTWQNESLWLLDNQSTSSAFNPISASELSKQGMMIAPQTLAAILQGHIPAELKKKGNGVWQGRLHKHMVNLKWQPSVQKLTVTDMTLGNTAIFLFFYPS